MMEYDFTALLVPINPEKPAGENLEYELLFDNIRQARESDADYLPQDEWSVSEPRKADWNRVRVLSEQALATQTKDLQLACWFTEALCHLQGLSGLLAGIGFLSEFITRFWFQFWPVLGDDGISLRRSRLLRLDRDLSLQLTCLPLLQHSNISLVFWRQVQAFEYKISIDPHTRDELILQEGDLTMETFNQQVAHLSSIEISQQAGAVDALAATISQLEMRYASLSQDQEGELFALTRQTLTDLSDLLQRLTQRAIPLTTEVIDLELSRELTSVDPAVRAAPLTMNRELAITQMLEISQYFRQTEPSSPVPFLMDRAARWANMTLTEWLEEMIHDQNNIHEINNVLTGLPR